MRSKKNQLTFHQKKKILTPKLVREIFSWLLITLFAIAIAFGLFYSFGMKVSVIGESMEPLCYNSQDVLIDRLFCRIVSPKKGDVIAFLPNGNVNSHYYVKRIVATSGDTLQIIDGELYINGEISGEDKEYFDKMEDAGIAENPIKLESGQFFVLGDNRNSSEDSRSANIGIVTSNMIVGKAWYIVHNEAHDGGFIFNTY